MWYMWPAIYSLPVDCVQHHTPGYTTQLLSCYRNTWSHFSCPFISIILRSSWFSTGYFLCAKIVLLFHCILPVFVISPAWAAVMSPHTWHHGYESHDQHFCREGGGFWDRFRCDRPARHHHLYPDICARTQTTGKNGVISFVQIFNVDKDLLLSIWKCIKTIHPNG